MAWIKLNPVNGPEAYFNTDNIAYIAAPPEEEAARGVGAGVAMIDNTRDVIPVLESSKDIIGFICWEENRKCGL